MSMRYPASFAQQRLWFLSHFDRDGDRYNVARALRLRGPVDVAALSWALDQIVARHESLRTTLHDRDGDVEQVIGRPAPVPLPMVDLGGLPRDEREERARACVQAETHGAFDLESGPLFRCRLLRLGEGLGSAEEHVLTLVFHHIVFDGWSLGVFYDELSRLYAARLAGRPSPLPELPAQYRDYSLWQRRQLSGAYLERELAYWRERLAGVSSLLDLPSDRPRPAVQSATGATHLSAFPAGLWERVVAFSRARRVTPFMTLLAAYAALLGRLARSRDLVIGTPIAGRTRAEFEPLIGFFVNTLPLSLNPPIHGGALAPRHTISRPGFCAPRSRSYGRARSGARRRTTIWRIWAPIRSPQIGGSRLRMDLSGNPSFEELLARVQRTALEAYAHQELPFQRLVEELRPERAMSHDPLVQVMFTFQNAPLRLPRLPGLKVERFPFPFESAFVDLWLDVSALDGHARANLQYKTDLFDAASVERLGRRLLGLLGAAVANPEISVSRLPILADDERRTVLGAWPNGGEAHPPEPPARELFAGQARARPDAIAATFAGRHLSYAELDRRANQLAHQLQPLGAGPDTPVGICLPRSFDLVVAVLGVLKAGAAYLPWTGHSRPRVSDTCFARRGPGWSLRRPSRRPTRRPPVRRR